MQNKSKKKNGKIDKFAKFFPLFLILKKYFKKMKVKISYIYTKENLIKFVKFKRFKKIVILIRYS